MRGTVSWANRLGPKLGGGFALQLDFADDSERARWMQQAVDR